MYKAYLAHAKISVGGGKKVVVLKNYNDIYI